MRRKNDRQTYALTRLQQPICVTVQGHLDEVLQSYVRLFRYAYECDILFMYNITRTLRVYPYSAINSVALENHLRLEHIKYIGTMPIDFVKVLHGNFDYVL